MKTFKSYNKEKKKERSGLTPAPIHFKYVEMPEGVQSTGSGIAPAAIHFKNILNTKKLNEEARTHKNLESWLKDRSENSHLSTKKDESAAHREVSDKLASTNNFSDEHKAHIAKYTGHEGEKSVYSTKMNKDLIKNKGKPSRAHQSTADGLSDAIQKNRVQHEAHVYSGASFDPREHLDDKGTLRSHAFISATHHKRVAFGYAQHSKAKGAGPYSARHIMHIRLRPGDPATTVAHHSGWKGEHETVIDRNTRLRHTGTTSHYNPDDERWYHIHHMEVADKD